MKTRNPKTEGAGRKAEAAGRKSDTRGQKADGRNQKSEIHRPAPDHRTPASRITSPLLVLISAPSGGGKTTLCRELLKARPDMARVVTCTTREPRRDEADGIDYHFLDHTSFLKRVQAGNFLEHAMVYGHSYGTLKTEVLSLLRNGKDVLLNVDVQGAASIRDRAEEDPELKRALVRVFLTPASLEVLEERLRKRGTDSEAAVQKRLSVARQEIAQWKNFDYLLISNTIPEDLRRMLAIIEAEKMRSARAMPPEA